MKKEIDFRIIIDDKIQSKKSTIRLINSYWDFCHKICCGETDFKNKCEWFQENHIEREEGYDSFMWGWNWKLFGLFGRGV